MELEGDVCGVAELCGKFAIVEFVWRSGLLCYDFVLWLKELSSSIFL